MKVLFSILFFVFICNMANAQTLPSVLPNPNSPSGFYQIGFLRATNGLISPLIDTTYLPKYTGTLVTRPNDRRLYFYDSTALRWYRLLTVQDTSNFTAKNIANSSLTSTAFHTQNWNHTQWLIDSIDGQFLMRATSIGSEGTRGKEFRLQWNGPSSGNGYDNFSLIGALKRNGSSADSIYRGLRAQSSALQLISTDAFNTVTFNINNALSATMVTNTTLTSKQEYIQVDTNKVVLFSDKDSIVIKGLKSATTADTILALGSQIGAIGNQILKVPLSSLGGGTVTSVGLSMPAAFTVSGSPVTSAGTLSVSGAGTGLDYIKGNGTLGTFDTTAIPNFYLKVRSELSGTSPITYNYTTGAIGITNANTSGTKGAATFNASSFSDNGLGGISLNSLITAGSCLNCQLTLGADGRVTSYADGAILAIANGNGAGDTLVVSGDTVKRINASYGLTSIPTASSITLKVDTSHIATQYDLTQLTSTTLSNVGSGFRWVKTGNGQIKTAFGSNTILVDSSSNTNALTFKADTSYLATKSDVNSKISNITGLISAGTNISITGSGTSGSPYVINSSGGGSTTLTYKNVGYGGIGNTLSTGEAQFQYDSITNTLNVDSVHLLNARINQDPYNADSVVYLGTSITLGTGQSAGNHYTTLLSNKLNTLEGNRGISGATLLVQGVANIPQLPIYNRSIYRWIVLEWGVNDIDVGGTDSTAFDTTYRKYIDTLVIARGWPASRIVILAPSYINPTVRPTSTLAKQAQFRGATHSIATAKGTKWVDIYSAELFRNPANLLVDGIHPNDYGAYIYVNSIYNTVKDSVMTMDQNLTINGYTELQRLKLRNSDTADYKSVVIGQDSSGNVVRYNKDQILQNSTTLLSPQGASINLIGTGYFGNVSSPNSIDKIQVNGAVSASGFRALSSEPSGETGEALNIFYAGGTGYIYARSLPSNTQSPISISSFGGKVYIGAASGSGGAEKLYISGGTKTDFGQFTGSLPGGMNGAGVEIASVSGSGYIGAVDRTGSPASMPLTIQLLGGNTMIGSNTDNGEKLQVNGTTRLTGLVNYRGVSAPPSTYNVLVHGLTDSILYQVPISSIATTYTFTNGLTNSGGTVSLGGALTGTTNITGSQVLNLGTSGSKLLNLNVVASGTIGLTGQLFYSVDAYNTDADHTVTSTAQICEITDALSTNRTLTLPTATLNGTVVTVVMHFSSGTNHFNLSAAVTDNATGSTFTQLDWGKTYDFLYDSGLAWRLIRKY